MSVRCHRILGSALAAALLPLAAAHAALPLPALKTDPNEVSVSGLSSGAFMAVQLHVAYSATFRRGAGIVAGGPFYCAEGSIVNATGRCMAHSSAVPVSSLVSTTRSWAASGALDAVSNLTASKVYLFSGTSDSTVRPAVMDDLKAYYQSFVPAANTVYNNTLGAGHAMITDDYGNSCASTGSPWINNCGFDLAGAMLKQLHGALNARNNGTLGGTLSEFDQTPFVSGHGMAATGWVYVPQGCSSGATACRVHVALHGCKQNVASIGDKFYRNAGYNRWADTNNMIVLYPQTSTAATNSCWDWWGYDSADYAKKSGPQMAAIKAMVDRLGSGSGGGGLPAPSGAAASGATDTSMTIAWGAVGGASGYNVYRGGSRVTATPVGATRYTDTGLTPATTYSWTVAAVDAVGVQGAMSAPATATTTGTAPPPPAPTCTTASNYAHTQAGRAHQSGAYALANGSNQNMGFWNIFVTTTLKRTAANYYVIGVC